MPSGIIFKGSGFYVTDYRSDSYKQAAKADVKPPAPAATPMTSSEAAEAVDIAVAIRERAADAASTLRVVSAAPAPTWPMTALNSIAALLVSEEARACSPAPAATWLIV